MVTLQNLSAPTEGCTCDACRALRVLRRCHYRLDQHLGQHGKRTDPRSYAVMDETYRDIEELLVDATLTDMQADEGEAQ